MESWETTPIGLEVRLVFARAAVQVIARRAGIRMLHIKGASIDRSLRATPRGGSDIDVMVDPAEVERMHAILLEHGWQVYSDFEAGSPFAHARTYMHREWGYLDLHRRFPGIRIPDDRAFELLWAGHSSHDAAGISCAVPSTDAQTVLLVLNAAREPVGRRAEARELWACRTPEEHERRAGLVRDLHAEVAFAAALGDLPRYRGRAEYPLWKAVSEDGGRIAEWWGRIRAAQSLAEALRIASRAPFVNREVLGHELGRSPTTKDLLSAYVRRVRVGLREIARRAVGR